MKKRLILFLTAISLIAFTGCSTDEDEGGNNNGGGNNSGGGNNNGGDGLEWVDCIHCMGTGVTLTYSGACPYYAGYCYTCKETAVQEHGHDVCRLCKGGQVQKPKK